ncbi:MAG: sensor domain-containing diguanylate cyclase [Lysobacterales bacterium]
MGNKHHRLWLYNLALVGVVAVLASQAPPWLAQWPALWVVLGFGAFQLLVWHYGFPVPSMGMTSMERVPQVAALLLFPLEVAATINALPALIFPFINRRYRQGSWSFAALRAVHNAAMIALISVLGGWSYQVLGGSVPISLSDWTTLWAVLIGMTVLQAANSVMILGFLWLDGRDVRRIASWNYLLAEELFVPLGLLAALICVAGEPVTTALFVLFLVLTVISLHQLVESRRQVLDRVTVLDAASVARAAVSGSQRMDQTAERLLDHIGALLPYHTAYVALHDTEREEFDVVLEVNDEQRQPRSRKPVGAGLSGHVLATGEPLRIDDWSQISDELRARAVVAPDEQPGSLLIVPIRHGTDVLGVVSVQHRRAGHYSEADGHALAAIADDLASVIADACTFEELDDYRQRLEDLVAERTADLEQASREREELLAELRRHTGLLEQQSREDPLTGLANRRYFDEQLAAAIDIAAAGGRSLALALIDLDHFKQVNDSAGHAVGDTVLLRFAALLMQHAPIEALVARIGGEEFAVLLPGLSCDSAVAAVELLRIRTPLIPIDDLPLRTPLRFSAGVCEWTVGDDADSLLRRADRGLYAAKAAGRDQVCAEPA